MTLVSVIIPTHNEGINLKRTVDSIKNNTDFEDYEIIIIDDSSTDDSLNFLKHEDYSDIKIFHTKERCPNKARNIGAKKSNGRTLIFMDAHVFPINSIWMKEIEKIIKDNEKIICGPCIVDYRNPEAKGYGCTIKGKKIEADWLWKKYDWPYKVPIVGAACLGISRKTYFDIGGFNDYFISWGYDDIELCIRAWLLGYEVFVLPDIEVYHIFRNTFPYDVKNDDVNFNLLTTAILHFNSKRIESIISEIKKESDISKILYLIKEKNIISERKKLIKKRKYSEDWLFEKFNIEI